MSGFRGPKGTYDVIPGGREPHERPELWELVEGLARATFERYNYTRVSTPVFEETEVFVRSSGEASDIVRKEMFSFRDKGGRELTLRPEGTAGVVRAYIQHGLYKLAQPVKLWYMGPMFRHERQQKGRYRQHTQIGAEVLGSEDPLLDVEVIALLYELHRSVGVRDEVFYINNIGDFESRRRYFPELRAFLEKHRSELDPDSVERIEINPMRTFDSKDPNTQAVLEEAPTIGEFLSEPAKEHFEQVKAGLEALEIPYEVDERLVRGLDYYTLTVFEAKSGALGAQDTVGAGGRYNGLVSLLGGPDVPGMGFGTGIERILLAASAPEERAAVDVFVVTLVREARAPALRLATELRREGISCDLDYAGRSAKGQFKQADRLSARRVLVLGEDELSGGYVTLRDMDSGEQRGVPLSDGSAALLRELAR
ncbi:histidine--tRNA ligase [Rubrobacter taiwanensis]|uniref:histidine--tRNA ligase n=1 Tax=Rubrobacter taiwanensis TaxID=185139 RepID=UPI0014054443|nr:histidine--tRNA ligase [Rubrobacter taiwanensis]